MVVRRVLARVGVAICALAIALLLLSFEPAQTSPMRYALDAVYTGAIGFHGYIAFNLLRAIFVGEAKAAMIVMGALWLASLGGLLFLIAAQGFALGAGDGGSLKPPSAAEWLESLAVWGLGAVFYVVLLKLAAVRWSRR